MTSAREEVLARVRLALSDVPADEPATWDGSAPAGVALAGEALVARFVERVADFGATVVRATDAADAADAVAAAAARHGARTLLVPDGFPAAWLPPTVAALHDRELDVRTVAAADGVLTTCAAAIGETGTLVLDAGPGQGRRLLTLLPDLHVCVVPAERIVPDVPDALPALRTSNPLTLVSGPSATSDIELERVEGVHGPRRLEVIVLG